MTIVLRVLLVFLLVSMAGMSHAQDVEATRILVTLADPGMSNSARSGPPRPGYTRRSSNYLVSVNVRRAANRIARDLDLRIVDEWPIVPMKVHCLVYAISSDVTANDILTQLRERPEVESAQLVNRFETSGTPVPGHADPYTQLQHGFEALEVAEAHTWSRGNGASVTVIDTGADVDHPDLVTQISAHHDFVDDLGGEFSADAHGTAVAGVIGAASDNGIGVAGIAPEADLVVLRACWYTANRVKAVCDSFTLAKALTHALESETDIINLSLGGPHDPLLSRLLALAIDSGIVIIAAAPADPGFPTDVPGVIVVGSEPVVESPAERALLLAPGDEILVPVPGGGFDYASGTSLSAAHVSGVAALLVARQPELAANDLTALLLNSHVDDSSYVNACRALADLLRQSGCRPVTPDDGAVSHQSESD